MKKIILYIKIFFCNFRLKSMTNKIKRNPKRTIFTQEQILQEIKIFIKYLMAISGYQFSVSGLDKTKNLKNTVIVTNHKSHLDVMTIQYYLPFIPGWFGKKELFDNKIFGHVGKLGKAYPIDRENAKQSSYQFLQAAKDFKKGRNLAIMPEGTRSKNEDMNEFKPLVFKFIKSLKADILPIKLDYKKSKINSDGSKNLKFNVNILDVIKYDDYKDKEIERITKEVHSIIDKAK